MNEFDSVGRDWVDISSEKWRRYDFGNLDRVTIQSPQKLFVSESGHRVLDSEGVSHYIPYGWIHLSWKGDPPFVL